MESSQPGIEPMSPSLDSFYWASREATLSFIPSLLPCWDGRVEVGYQLSQQNANMAYKRNFKICLKWLIFSSALTGCKYLLTYVFTPFNSVILLFFCFLRLTVTKVGGTIMWCPSPHWRERGIYQLIWEETAKLFQHHHHTIVHLHGYKQKLMVIVDWMTCSCPSVALTHEAAVPPSPVLGCPSHSLPLLVCLIVMSWKRLYWGSMGEFGPINPPHKPLISEPHLGGAGAWGIAVSSEIQVSLSIQWVLLRPNRIRWSDSTESAFMHSSCPGILKTSSERTTRKSRRAQQKLELLLFSSCAFFTRSYLES